MTWWFHTFEALWKNASSRLHALLYFLRLAMLAPLAAAVSLLAVLALPLFSTFPLQQELSP